MKVYDLYENLNAKLTLNKSLLKKVLFVFCVFLVFNNNSSAQNNFGLANSNYNSGLSVYLNPATITDSKNYMDFNVFGLNLYINNDFASIRRKALYKASRDSVIDTLKSFEDDFRYNNKFKKYNTYSEMNVILPSIIYSSGNNGFGFSLRDRTITDIRRIPGIVTGIANGDLDFDEVDVDNLDQFTFENLSVSSISYMEILATASRIIKKSKYQLITAGASIKYMIPHGGAGFKFHEVDYSYDYELQDTNNIYLNVNSELMFSSSDGDLMLSQYPDPLITYFNGSGWGMDAGIEVKHTTDEVRQYYPNSPLSRCREVGYKYKWGISILDWGSVKLKNVSNTVFNYQDTLFVVLEDSALAVKGTDKITSSFFDAESSTGGTVKKPYKMKLPTALAFQFEGRIMPDLYLAVNYIYGFPRSPKAYGPQRASVLAVTGRIEKERFEIGIPITIYEWRQVHLGLVARYGFFYIGTDMLSNYLFKENVYGMDLFFGFKVRIPEHGACHKKIKGADRKSFVHSADMKKDFRIKHAKD